jgi:diaminopimelate epimerase
MKIEFTKMNGAGNDFVLIDDRSGDVRLTSDQIRHICDRRRGVGADGLILIQSDPAYDFHMSYFNSDGHPAEMCGNGSRCSASFAASLGLGRRQGDVTRVRLSTDSGPMEGRVAGGRATMDMMDATHMRRDIRLRVAQTDKTVHFMIVGTRHAVMFVDEVTDLTESDIIGLGRAIRYDRAFGPVGANVNFASVDESGTVHLRTYEKGVEAETHACGTGSVASAVLLAHQGRLESPVTVVQHSGDRLVVTFEVAPEGATNVTLEGPVAVNFTGSLDL